MTYDKPEIRDFGDIAKHTYQTDDVDICYPGASCDIVYDAVT